MSELDALPWRSHSGAPRPKRWALVDDTLNADRAYKLVCEGTALLWQGDYHQARQMLQALARRIEQARARRKAAAPATLLEAFHQHRKAQAERARILGLLVLRFEAGHALQLRRAPDVRAAAEAAIGAADQPYLASLRELLGWIGAWEWRQQGVPVPALGGARIHPHYGVFSPVRGEYLDLIAQASLPTGARRAWDIGTGSGVIAALLARRGLQEVVATDNAPAALACAAETFAHLGLPVRLREADLFPKDEPPADLIVCNPPWLPGKASSAVETAVYDPDSRMLKGFLAGVGQHLAPRGEAWLILSDLAELLGLRSRAELEAWIAAAGLKVLGRLDIRPRHGKAQDREDPLHAARSKEVTSLWRLGRAG
ncbi:methyltransferase [Inhella sp.]|uniref:methyltransferase n=1 Tax=Inhella sp. TaxID=1921806 RepID=UPI0035B34436